MLLVEDDPDLRANAIIHHGRLDPGVAPITRPFSLSCFGAKLRQVLSG